MQQVFNLKKSFRTTKLNQGGLYQSALVISHSPNGIRPGQIGSVSKLLQVHNFNVHITLGV